MQYEYLLHTEKEVIAFLVANLVSYMLPCKFHLLWKYELNCELKGKE